MFILVFYGYESASFDPVPLLLMFCNFLALIPPFLLLNRGVSFPVLKNFLASAHSFLGIVLGFVLAAGAIDGSAGRAQSGRPAASAPIDAKSLCGIWKALPKSGGFHRLNASNGINHGKSGDEKGSIAYTITQSSERTLQASQDVDMSNGAMFHMNDGHTSKGKRILLGVTNRTSVVFAVLNEPAKEVWEPIGPNTFDVVGIETGPHAMTYHFVVKQVSKTGCL